jgi:hypothetical protein
MIRLFLMIAVALAMAILPASAQTGTGSDKKAHNKLAEKADADAYKAALRTIPDAADKYDPWAIARPSPPEGKPGKVK